MGDKQLKNPPMLVRTGNQPATHEEARHIFGKNFIEEKVLGEVYGGFAQRTVTPILFTAKELEHFASKDPNLMLVPETRFIWGRKDWVCIPLTIENAWKLAGQNVTLEGSSVLSQEHFDKENLDQRCNWYMNDHILPSQMLPLSPAYRLRTKECIDMPRKKQSFVEHLSVICDYVERLYEGILMPPIYRLAIDDWRSKEGEFLGMQDTELFDVGKSFQAVKGTIAFAAGSVEMFMRMPAARLFMENHMATVNALLLYEKQNQEVLLKGRKIRNNTFNWDGVMISTGASSTGGIYISNAELQPEYEFDAPGVVFSAIGTLDVHIFQLSA